MNNWKTTTSGILTIIGAVVAIAVKLFRSEPLNEADLALLGSAIATGVGLFHARDAAPSLPVLPPAPPRAGFVRLGLLFVLPIVALFLLVAAPRARASDPQLGGCLKNGTTCFGPSLGLALLSVDLESGVTTGTFAPGAGYGVTWFTGKWYEAGANLHITLRPASNGQQVVPSAVFSFARYLQLGFGSPLGKSAKPFLLFGIGTSTVGVTPGAPVPDVPPPAP